MKQLTKKEESLISALEHNILYFHSFLERIRNYIEPIYEKYYAPNHGSAAPKYQSIVDDQKFYDRTPIRDIMTDFSSHLFTCFSSDVIKETDSFLQNIMCINQEAQNSFFVSPQLATLIKENYNDLTQNIKKRNEDEFELTNLHLLYKDVEYLTNKINNIKNDVRNYITDTAND